MSATPSRASLEALGRLVAVLLEGGTTLAPELDRTLPQELVFAHGLGPLAYRGGLESYKLTFIENALAAELRARVLAELCEGLDAAGVELCYLKGCAYVQELYDDAALRPMSDLDILVRPECMDEAIRALGTLGFVPREGKEFMFAPTHHAVTLDRSDISVDLHRSMTQARRTRIDLESLWQRADTERHRLDPVDETVLHIIHMVRHELMVPLISWVDLHRLLQTEQGMRQRVIHRSDEYRAGRGARIVLQMLDTLRVGAGGGRGSRYPLPSRQELLSGELLGRRRQLLAKAALLEGPREVLGLAATTLSERGRRWR